MTQKDKLVHPAFLLCVCVCVCVGHLVNHVRLGREVQKLVHAFPMLNLAASIQPITRTVIKVRLEITPDFTWNDRIHGSTSEPFWVWVEDAENNHMYHNEYFLLQRKQVTGKSLYSRTMSRHLGARGYQRL